MEGGKQRMWESLRTDARHLDAEIERKMSVLESLATSEDTTTAASRFDFCVSEVQQLVKKLQQVVMSMDGIMQGVPHTPETLAVVNHTQRFQDILNDKNRTIRHFQQEFKRRRERAELLTKAHSEITVYNDSAEMRHLAAEQDSMHHTQRKMNEIFSQAELSRERLKAQRNMFTGISDKVLTIAERVPFVSNVLKKIDAKRRRDVVILALVIALCVLLIIIFW